MSERAEGVKSGPQGGKTIVHGVHAAAGKKGLTLDYTPGCSV